MTAAGSRTVIPKHGGKTPLLTERHSAVPLCKGRRGHLRIIPIHYINPFLFTVRQSVRHFANIGTLLMRGSALSKSSGVRQATGIEPVPPPSRRAPFNTTTCFHFLLNHTRRAFSSSFSHCIKFCTANMLMIDFDLFTVDILRKLNFDQTRLVHPCVSCADR